MNDGCNVDPLIHKLGIKNIEHHVDEAIALGLEYIKVCGDCNRFTICAYISIITECSSCRVNLLGLTISVNAKEPVDEKILTLLKYSFMVIGSTYSDVVFYITKEYSMGVCRMVCEEGITEWKDYTSVDYEEISAFLNGCSNCL